MKRTTTLNFSSKIGMKSIFLLLLTLSFGNTLNAQTGQVDETFEGALYERFGTGEGTNYGDVKASLLLPNGKIIIGGDFTGYDGKPYGKLVRLNQDGSLDTTFHFQNTMSVSALVLLSNGDILVGGSTGLLKVNPDGSNSATFQSSYSGTFGYVTDVAVQADQKIVVVGSFSTFQGTPQNDVVRLNPDGTIDNTFNIGVGPSTSGGNMNSVAIQPDQKIVLGGSFTIYNSASCGRIVRLNTDGSQDLTFNPGTGMDGTVYSVAVQPNGKIVAVGSFSLFNGMGKMGIVSMLPNGTFDPDFSTGIGAMDLRKVVLQSDGDIVIGGYFLDYDSQPAQNVAILDSTGILQYSLTGVGGPVLTLQVQPDNKIISGGSISKGVVRSLSDGSMDFLFNTWVGSNGQIYDQELLPNGKMIIAGDFTYYDGYPSNRIARLNSDGTLDQTFTAGLGTDSQIYSVTALADGKILIGGAFTTYNGIVKNKLARLNADGSLDLSFDAGSGTDGHIFDILVLSNGKILINGDFYSYNGTNIVRLARLNSNGSIDQTFNLDLPQGVTVGYGIALLPDGRIVAAGSYYNGSFGERRSLRLSSDGVFDVTYDFSTQVDFSPTSVKIQSDSKTLIGGYSTSTTVNILRLNPDGTVDPTFNPGTGFDGEVWDVTLLPNGKILVGGVFNEYNGHNCTNLARLNADGSFDTGFETQISFSSSNIRSVKVKPNGQIMIAGFFRTYLDKPAHYITRLNNDVAGISNMQITFDSITSVTCSNPGNIQVVPYFGVPPYTYSWQTTPVETQQSIHPNQTGFYTVSVTDSTGFTDQKTVFLAGYETANVDLSSYLVTGEFRPGFNAEILVVPTNKGCTPADAEMKVLLPGLLTFNSANPTPSSISGDTLIWELNQLVYSDDPLSLSISVTTSTSALVGDSILIATSITSNSTDEVPGNNAKTYKVAVVNGYDPNYITMSPFGKCDEHFVPVDEALTYTIHFQNTGNSEAINIYLIDSLDPALDLSTLKLIDKSHDLWIEPFAGNVLKFHFENIHLADSSTNEPESHGYVIFEVSPEQNSTSGTITYNQAEIYFDFNPAVITNSVFGTLYSGDLSILACDSSLQTEEIGSFKTKVFPNPFTNEFRISREEGGTAEIMVTDMQGKIVLPTSETSDELLVIQTSSFQTGIYLLHLKANGAETVFKIVKE